MFFLPLVFAIAASADDLTLDRAVELALKSNPSILNARLELSKTDLQIDIARTYRLPRFHVYAFEGQALKPVDFTFPAGIWGVYPSTGPIPANPATIQSPRHPFTLLNGSITQSLTELGKVRQTVNLRQTEKEAAQQKAESVRLEVVNNVRKLYYSILQTQSAGASSESSIAALHEEERVTADNVTRRVALNSEVLGVRARLAKAEYEAANLKQELAIEKEQLNDLMGRDPATDFSIAPLGDTTLTLPNPEEARRHALASHPAIRAAELRIRAAQQDRDIKHAERLPSVDLAFQYLSPFSIAVVPKNIAAVGFQVDWDVFDWGRRNKELAIRDAAIGQAKNDLTEERNQIALEVDRAYRKLEEASRLLKVLQTAQEAAAERVRIIKDRVDEKAMLRKDLLDAQSAQAEADYQYQQALSSFLSARADFDKASGSQ